MEAELTAEDFQEAKPEINLEEFNALQKEIWEEHIAIKAATAALKARNSDLIIKKSKFEDLLNAYKMREAVCEHGTVKFECKKSFKVPTDVLAKKELFNYIKETYDNATLMGYVSINSGTLNSWANIEMEKAFDREDHKFVIPGLGKPTEYEALKFKIKPGGKKK